MSAEGKIAELFGITASRKRPADWASIVARQHCPFLNRKCIKVRKSTPEISIGTCTVRYGISAIPVVICPKRFLERRQVFMDCVHLLGLHEPGNELHVVPEVTVPGGSVDYFLASSSRRRVVDFVGIELQTLDSTGTIWPERQRFLEGVGLRVDSSDTESTKAFGMNWKMTAKTILVQLHHKLETFQAINRHLVLVVQDVLLSYMRREFAFDHVHTPGLAGDPLHFHSYRMDNRLGDLRLVLAERASTDAAGVAACLGLHESPRVELSAILSTLDSRISDDTLLTIA